MPLMILLTAIQKDVLGCALVAMNFTIGWCAVLWPRAFVNRRHWGSWLPWIYLKGLILMGAAVFFTIKLLPQLMDEWLK